MTAVTVVSAAFLYAVGAVTEMVTVFVLVGEEGDSCSKTGVASGALAVTVVDVTLSPEVAVNK